MVSDQPGAPHLLCPVELQPQGFIRSGQPGEAAERAHHQQCAVDDQGQRSRDLDGGEQDAEAEEPRLGQGEVSGLYQAAGGGISGFGSGPE